MKKAPSGGVQAQGACINYNVQVYRINRPGILRTRQVFYKNHVMMAWPNASSGRNSIHSTPVSMSTMRISRP